MQTENIMADLETIGEFGQCTQHESGKASDIMSRRKDNLHGVPAEKQTEFAARRKAIKQYIIIAFMMAVASSLSIICGIVILVKGTDSSFPVNTGSPIWCGAAILVEVFFTLPLGCTDSSWTSNSRWNPNGGKKTQRRLVYIINILTVVSIFASAFSTFFSFIAVADCNNKDEKTCGTNFEIELIMNVITGILGSFLFVTSCITSFMFCYHRKAFHYYSSDDRIKQMRQFLSTT